MSPVEIRTWDRAIGGGAILSQEPLFSFETCEMRPRPEAIPYLREAESRWRHPRPFGERCTGADGGRHGRRDALKARTIPERAQEGKGRGVSGCPP